jgi:hypothetical protein
MASPKTDDCAEPLTHNPLLSALISSRLVMVCVPSNGWLDHHKFKDQNETSWPVPEFFSAGDNNHFSAKP